MRFICIISYLFSLFSLSLFVFFLFFLRLNNFIYHFMSPNVYFYFYLLYFSLSYQTQMSLGVLYLYLPWNNNFLAITSTMFSWLATQHKIGDFHFDLIRASMILILTKCPPEIYLWLMIPYSSPSVDCFTFIHIPCFYPYSISGLARWTLICCNQQQHLWKWI